ncbi:ATP-binding protein [Candidatus Omnitrophota bacterium]
MIIGSVILGIIVANFAKMRGYVEGRTIETKRIARPEGSLTSAVFQEVGKLSIPPDEQKQVSLAISNVFTEELDRKVDSVREELSKRYEIDIKETKETSNIVNQKYEKLSKEKKQTEAVIRSISDGLVVVNEKGEVLLMNPAAEKLLDVKREEKVGKSILKDIKDEHLVSLTGKSQNKEGTEIEVIGGEDETKKVLRASTAVIENEYGKTVGMVSVLSDVTKQKELDQMKSDFVSNVSHELRMPIGTIQNSISLLLSKATGSLNGDQEKFLTIAQRNLKRLAVLIDNLLDLSKLEASMMKLRLTSCSIEKTIDEVCDTMTPWANTKGIRIQKMVQKDLPEINLDFDKIIQVLNNIVGNAVKFTPKNGTVTIEAGLAKDEKNAFIVSITDTGIGIAKKSLDKVFGKFQQVGDSVSKDMGGTGLGLAIAKEIVELHKGRIWVDSEEGKRTTFSFTLSTDLS